MAEPDKKQPPAPPDTSTQRQEMPSILFCCLDDKLFFKPPERSHPDDAGLDLYVAANMVIHANARTLIPHNIAVVMPQRYYGQILPRSSTLHQKGLIILPGTVDSGFRGELYSIAYNPTPRGVSIYAGEKLSQLVVHRLWTPETRQLKKEDFEQYVKESGRGIAGFGSTGGFVTRENK